MGPFLHVSSRNEAADGQAGRFGLTKPASLRGTIAGFTDDADVAQAGDCVRFCGGTAWHGKAMLPDGSEW